MNMSQFFKSVGGVGVYQGGETVWNFGIRKTAAKVITEPPALWAARPELKNHWNKTSPVNCYQAVTKTLGGHLPAQKQPTGTCGGRAGSGGGDFLQCMQIQTGKRSKFYRLSHAFIYAAARKDWNMLGRGDGVAGGSVPPAMHRHGVVHREESGDTDFAGARSDDLAGSWGAGGAPQEMYDLAGDNPVKDIYKCNSFEEYADGVAAGMVGVVSDNHGFAMTRSSDGFCRPQGSWAHYHLLWDVVFNRSGDPGGVYYQSWGENVPDGPLLPGGYPSYAFGITKNSIDDIARRESLIVISAFQAWELEETNLSWIFL